VIGCVVVLVSLALSTSRGSTAGTCGHGKWRASRRIWGCLHLRTGPCRCRRPHSRAGGVAAAAAAACTSLEGGVSSICTD